MLHPAAGGVAVERELNSWSRRHGPALFGGRASILVAVCVCHSGTHVRDKTKTARTSILTFERASLGRGSFSGSLACPSFFGFFGFFGFGFGLRSRILSSAMSHTVVDSGLWNRELGWRRGFSSICTLLLCDLVQSVVCIAQRAQTRCNCQLR